MNLCVTWDFELDQLMVALRELHAPIELFHVLCVSNGYWEADSLEGGFYVIFCMQAILFSF